MKTNPALAFRILALALLTATPCAFAQTAVPNSMSYQGRISDANGNLVGSPTPVNRTVIFRVWDSPTANAPANLLYSEQQIVTIASGEFNVLVGQGLQVGTEPKPAFDTVFNGAQRFLGVTVDDGTAAVDPEITPRQQLVTSAFAFRAKTAEGVPANAITSSMLAAGAVTANSIAANTIDGTKLAIGAALANIAANSIDSTKLATSAVTTASIAANAINSSKLADGSVTAAKLDSAIGVWTSQGGNVYRASGRVGVGTTSPGAPIQVNLPTAGRTAEALRLSGGSDAVNGPALVLGVNIPNNREIWIGDTARINNTSDNAQIRLGLLANSMGCNYIDSLDNGVPKNLAFCPVGGNVGIGTLAPTEARLVVSGSVTKGSITAGYLQPGGAGSNTLFTNHDISIQTSHSIWTGGTVLSTSDERIKNVRGVSDGAADLGTLVGIEITDYTHRDIISKGAQPQKKVIAQQVEKVFPQAVERHTDVVPDIYQRAGFKDGWVELETNVKVGERVKLIGAKTEGVHEVLEVKAGRFRTDFKPEGDLVFVYGREVKDFRTVDYDAISMLNVSATQQLKKEKDAEIKALREENAALRSRLATIEAQDHARDARLVAIEKALRTSSGPVVPEAAATTVSVK